MKSCWVSLQLVPGASEFLCRSFHAIKTAEDSKKWGRNIESSIIPMFHPHHFTPMKSQIPKHSCHVPLNFFTGWAHRFAWKRSCGSFFRCPLTPGGRWLWRRGSEPCGLTDFSGLTWFNHQERRFFIMILGQFCAIFSGICLTPVDMIVGSEIEDWSLIATGSWEYEWIRC